VKNIFTGYKIGSTTNTLYYYGTILLKYYAAVLKVFIWFKKGFKTEFL
jgi:hypothetical protein